MTSCGEVKERRASAVRLLFLGGTARLTSPRPSADNRFAPRVERAARCPCHRPHVRHVQQLHLPPLGQLVPPLLPYPRGAEQSLWLAVGGLPRAADGVASL
eukprot:TRINITY_DN57887_c0_g1_i1.p4 TRINITY_DN57887_c0_g1~~TRINITY_DN57887_c0_g1_i1.p4  ORF type:complete len:101 (-),score=13.01 TRINITY_DN57887_c0_g1_i1:156-458(-)